MLRAANADIRYERQRAWEHYSITPGGGGLPPSLGCRHRRHADATPVTYATPFDVLHCY